MQHHLALAGSSGASPQLLVAAVPDPWDPSRGSLSPPSPSWISRGSPESTQSSSTLPCKLTSDCTWICKNHRAEEIMIAPNSAFRTALLSASRNLPHPSSGAVPLPVCSQPLTAHGLPGSLRPLGIPFSHRKMTKVAAPALSGCGYLVLLLGNSTRARTSSVYTNVYYLHSAL